MRMIIVLLLVLAYSATAEMVYFSPGSEVGKDSYTADYSPDENFGGVGQIFCGHVEGLAAMTAFIKFEELNDSQYQGATVVEATLWLWVYDYDDAGQFQFAACSAFWDEYAITWNTMPSYHSTVFINYPSELGFMEFDVTDWVQNWLDGSWSNNGFGFFDNTGTYDSISFRSSDYTNAALHPILYIEYLPEALEQNTWGSIKAIL